MIRLLWQKGPMNKENKRKESARFIRRLFWFGIMLAVIVLSGLSRTSTPRSHAAERASYTVKPSTAPYQKKYITSSTYNSKTKQYYMLRSYLEKLEKEGGGTLILLKGTYTITNTLYVPSGVTILMRDGVKLVKGADTGTKKLAPAKSMFQLIAPKKSAQKGVAAKYLGESNITLRGEGTVILDLHDMKDATGIVLGHNDNVTIEGITFQKQYGGSYIKIGASRNVRIEKNVFRSSKTTKEGNSYAVAIEVPDSLTKSFAYPWSKDDKTICKNITIERNTFSRVERGIGSLKFTQDKYHSNLSILYNTFEKTGSHAIRVLNWEDCTVKNNSFIDLQNEAGTLKAILVSGGKNPTIKDNNFLRTDRAIQIMPWKNTNNGEAYGITYNWLSEQNIADIKDNDLAEMEEYFIRYNKTYNEFTLNTEKWEIYDPGVTEFIINETSEPFQNSYKNYSTYNSTTKQYYVLRSYLEQLERTGGGTLTLEAGTYRICNTLYVPSRVTLLLKDGVTIMKTEETGLTELTSSKSLFQLVAPSKSKIEGAYGGYKGETDITIQGTGTAVIDLGFIQDAIGVVLGHNTEVTISGITFRNMNSGHFIELDASSEVTIRQNSFLHHKPSASGVKEAINLDTPDRNTGGFNVIWTKYDGTPNRNILIRENTFDDLERAIGTHKYTEGKYHENIQIIDNKISNTTSDAIRILNWTAPVIKGNEIRMVAGGNGTDRAILASGLKAPVITGNSFTDVPRPIQLMPWKNSIEGEGYEITYNELTFEDIDRMLKNTLTRCGENFIRINRTYNIFDRDTDKYYYSSEYIKR